MLEPFEHASTIYISMNFQIFHLMSVKDSSMKAVETVSLKTNFTWICIEVEQDWIGFFLYILKFNLM